MRIETSTHEHGATGKVFGYEAEYEVTEREIRWTAQVGQAGEAARELKGTIALTSPALPRLAEEVVRDAVVQAIDAEVDRGSATLAPAPGPLLG